MQLAGGLKLSGGAVYTVISVACARVEFPMPAFTAATIDWSWPGCFERAEPIRAPDRPALLIPAASANAKPKSIRPKVSISTSGRMRANSTMAAPR